jgi:hypothetical protein
MAKRPMTNIEKVTHIMTFSDYGALAQCFVIDALHKSSNLIRKASPDSISSGLISAESWIGVAKEIHDRLNTEMLTNDPESSEAPELLDALENAVDGLMHGAHPFAQAIRIKNARAAIAKAKGNSLPETAPALKELYRTVCAAHDKLSDTLEGDSNDDEHDAAVGLCEALNDFHAAYSKLGERA